MTHDELREKVARAIAAIEANGPATDWEIWLPEADAALAAVREALREPNWQMHVAGGHAIRKQPDAPWVSQARDAYDAMLAASPLSEPRA